MTPLIRFMSWMVAIGNGGAAANAWHAIEERAQADAAVDALCARVNVAQSVSTQSGDTQSGSTQSASTQSGSTAPSRAA